MNMVIG